jgi:hypothetical protein
MVKIIMKVLMKDVKKDDKIYKVMGKLFVGEHSPDAVKDAERFAKNLCEKMLNHGVIEDLPRSGRPRVLSDQHVDTCTKLFKQGVTRKDGTWYGFTSLQHAVTECAGIRRIWEESNVTIDQLWNRMKEMQYEVHKTGFNKITIHVRPKFAADVKEERLQKATEWATLTLDQLACYFWIDEKTLYVHNHTYRCYAPDDQKPCIMEAPLGPSKARRLKYIACVNALIGPVYIAFLSGTSDFDSGFKVRTVVP